MAFAKVYDRRNALVAAELLNGRVIPFFEEQAVRLLRILTDRGTEYRGIRGSHEHQLYLAVEDLDHTRTRVKRAAIPPRSPAGHPSHPHARETPTIQRRARAVP